MPVEYRVVAEGIDFVISGLSAAQMRKMRGVTNQVKRLADIIASNIRRHAPKRTGALASSIKARTSTFARAEVVEGKSYGLIQREGTRKKNYFIFPRREGGALFWPGLSHPVPWVGEPYTRRHPGIKPNPYDARGVADSQGAVAEVAAQIGNEYVITITRGGRG